MFKLSGDENSYFAKILSRGCYKTFKGEKCGQHNINGVLKNFQRLNRKIKIFSHDAEKKCRLQVQSPKRKYLYEGLGEMIPAGYNPGMLEKISSESVFDQEIFSMNRYFLT